LEGSCRVGKSSSAPNSSCTKFQALGWMVIGLPANPAFSAGMIGCSNCITPSYEACGGTIDSVGEVTTVDAAVGVVAPVVAAAAVALLLRFFFGGAPSGVASEPATAVSGVLRLRGFFGGAAVSPAGDAVEDEAACASLFAMRDNGDCVCG
jgi:hypothetical protein